MGSLPDRLYDPQRRIDTDAQVCKNRTSGLPIRKRGLTPARLLTRDVKECHGGQKRQGRGKWDCAEGGLLVPKGEWKTQGKADHKSLTGNARSETRKHKDDLPEAGESEQWEAPEANPRWIRKRRKQRTTQNASPPKLARVPLRAKCLRT